MKQNHKKHKPSFDETYNKQKEFFGHPYLELQNYFQNYPTKGTLLDLGSGQGRDSIFLASIGYKVTAVDNTKVGISQMLNKARKMGLQIKAIEDNVLEVQLEEKFDIILFDMLLHTFKKYQQIELLRKFSNNLKNNAIMCIIFPDDIKTDYFMNLLNSIPNNWTLLDEIIIRDVPKIPQEDIDFTFTMIVVELTS